MKLEEFVTLLTLKYHRPYAIMADILIFFVCIQISFTNLALEFKNKKKFHLKHSL